MATTIQVSWIPLVLFVIHLSGAAAAPPPSDGPFRTREDVLERVRTELGVDKVTSFELTGIVQKLAMGVTAEGPKEVLRAFRLVVRWDASGRYVRMDTFDTPDGAITMRAGFDGSKLLNELRGSSPENVKLAARFSPEQIVTERRNARRLVLALFLNTTGVAVEHAGANSFMCRLGDSSLDRLELVLDETVGRPQVIRYTVMARRSPAEPDSATSRELHIESYRRFERAQVPTVLKTYEAGRLIESIEIGNVRLNPAFGSAAFSPSS